MGALSARSYKVTPPSHFACNGTIYQADQSIQGQQNRVRLTVSQTQQVMPPTSSVAYGTP